MIACFHTTAVFRRLLHQRGTAGYPLRLPPSICEVWRPLSTFWMALPALRSSERSCRKARKGARPVPGPTMTMGVMRSLGRRKLLWRMKTGTSAPAFLCFR